MQDIHDITAIYLFEPSSFSWVFWIILGVGFCALIAGVTLFFIWHKKRFTRSSFYLKKIKQLKKQTERTGVKAADFLFNETNLFWRFFLEKYWKFPKGLSFEEIHQKLNEKKTYQNYRDAFGKIYATWQAQLYSPQKNILTDQLKNHLEIIENFLRAEFVQEKKTK